MENEILTNSGEKENVVADHSIEQNEDLNGEKETRVADVSVEEEQSPEENARYAAIRRRAEEERDMAIKKEREKFVSEREKIETDAIASLGILNPITGDLVKTRADYQKIVAHNNENAMKDLAQRTGLSEKEIAMLVDSLPEVQQAKLSARQAKDAAVQAKLSAQVKEISSLDPSVKTINDLLSMDNYSKFEEYVKRGYSLTDAYKLTNFDRLTRKNDAVTRQSALNSINSKSHMTPTGIVSPPSSNTSVPEDVREQYKKLIPGITDAEIQKHYSKNKKG